MKRYNWLLIVLGFGSWTQADTPAGDSAVAVVQDVAARPLDDFFYQSGKIYVVIAVLVIIFSLLAFYLVRLDRKITNIEKERNES